MEHAPRTVAVYGTLRRGERNHAALGTASARSIFSGEGWVEGRLFELPPAAQAATPYPYPLLVLAAGEERVAVELYTVRDATLWAELDELEGSTGDDPEYARRVVTVHRAGGDHSVAAWVYEHAGPATGAPITGGDWVRHRAAAGA